MITGIWDELLFRDGRRWPVVALTAVASGTAIVKVGVGVGLVRKFAFGLVMVHPKIGARDESIWLSTVDAASVELYLQVRSIAGVSFTLGGALASACGAVWGMCTPS